MKTKATQLLLLVSAALLAFVGHPDTAQAQNTVAFSPNPVVLNTLINNQNLVTTTVSVTVNGVPATSVMGVGSTGYLSATSGTNTITVIANPQGLQAGTYTGSIAVTANGNVAGTLPVTLNIYSNANTVTVDQPSLTFNAAVNGSAPASQTVNVTGSTPGIPVSVAVATTSGGNFLTATATGQAVPTQVIVSANPTGLAAGTYNGTVTVSSLQGQPQVINVTLNVSGQPLLVVNPNPLNLIYQTGVNAAAPTATIQIGSTVSQIAYFGNVNYLTCGNWFTVTSGLSGNTNSQLLLTVNLAAVGANTQCTGNIVITAPSAGNSPVTVNVNLTTSPLPLLNVSPVFANFSYSLGGAVPAAQNFSVASSGSTPLNFSVASAGSPNFLMVPSIPPNGFPTPGTFALALNQSVLATLNPGTYTNTVTISALGSGAPVTVPVTLTVSNNPLVTVSSSFLNFNYQTGTQVPAGLSVNLLSTMGSLPFTVSVPTTAGSGPQFVQTFPVSGTASGTPTAVTINLVPSVVVGLVPGTYQNQVQVTGGGGSQLLTINLTVSASPLVNIAPQQLSFTFAQNGNQPLSQSLTLTSTNGGNLPVSFSSNQAFILVGPSNVSTPGTVNVSVQPGGLTPGTYTGQITVTSGTQTQVVPVTLTVTSGIGLSTNPTSLSFSQTAGGPASAAQTVNVILSGSAVGVTLPYSVTTSTVTGGGWLLLNGGTPTASGSAPGSFTVTANGANLAPGTYQGTVVVTSVGTTNSSVVIPVTLTVTAQALLVTPASLTFNAAVQGAAPASQNIAVTSSSITNLSFTATAQSTPAGWLSVSPASGTTPQNVTVTVNQAGLAAGTYTGSVTLTVAGSAPVNIPVTLTVGAQSVPLISRVVNAASFAAGPVAPGELVSFFGTALGPLAPVGLTLNAQGNVATTLSNVQVLFDGIAAPLTFVSAAQINAVVPYEVFGRTTTNVVVTFNGVSTAAMQLTVASSAPGLFSLNSVGNVAVNQNGTLNVAAAPAAKGSIVTVYGTGGGQITPAGVTGSVTAGATSLLNPVTVTIGGVPATLAYAGSAPGLVSGVLQFNITIPADAPSGAAVPIVITATGSGAVSQSTATIAIQ